MADGMFSRIGIDTRRRRRRGMFERYHSIENNDDRVDIWSFAVTYGEVVLKRISEGVLLLEACAWTLQFSFSNKRFFVGGGEEVDDVDSDRLEMRKKIKSDEEELHVSWIDVLWMRRFRT